MQIIDYVIIGVAALFLIVGLIRGLIKMSFGLLAGLASIVIAVMLCSPITNAVIVNTKWDDDLANKLSTVIDVGTSTYLVYEKGPSGDILGFYDENGQFQEFKEIFNGDPVLKTLSGLIESGIRHVYSPDNAEEAKPQTASFLISAWLAFLIILVASFIVMWIAAAIVLKIISILLKKFVTATHVGHFLDRILGAVLGVALAWVLVMVVFTVIEFMKGMEFMTPVMEHINSSVIGKFLLDNNFLYKLFDGNINFENIFSGGAAAASALSSLA